MQPCKDVALARRATAVYHKAKPCSVNTNYWFTRTALKGNLKHNWYVSIDKLDQNSYSFYRVLMKTTNPSLLQDSLDGMPATLYADQTTDTFQVLCLQAKPEIIMIISGDPETMEDTAIANYHLPPRTLPLFTRFRLVTQDGAVFGPLFIAIFFVSSFILCYLATLIPALASAIGGTPAGKEREHELIIICIAGILSLLFIPVFSWWISMGRRDLDLLTNGEIGNARVIDVRKEPQRSQKNTKLHLTLDITGARSASQQVTITVNSLIHWPKGISFPVIFTPQQPANLRQLSNLTVQRFIRQL